MMSSSDHQNISAPKRKREEQAQPFSNINSGPNHFYRENDAEAFRPGYRFWPLDGELIVYYLQKKVKNEPMPYNRIPDVNLYMHNPEHLADQYQALGEDIWYFFSPRERKYPKGNRPKRAAGEGYWKASGADKLVEHQGVVVGKKKSLVYYAGKPPKGDKTDWLMQEYTVDAPPRIKKDEDDMRLDDWVLCKIYNLARGRKAKKGGQEEENDHEQMADASTSLEEEVIQGANYDNYNMSSGYNIQPAPSRFCQAQQHKPIPNIPNPAANFSEGSSTCSNVNNANDITEGGSSKCGALSIDDYVLPQYYDDILAAPGPPPTLDSVDSFEEDNILDGFDVDFFQKFNF